jgi:V8-like Glu-specific endopeptidase
MASVIAVAGLSGCEASVAVATPAKTPRSTPSAHPAYVAGIKVGALFDNSVKGSHFCTASVVASPGDNLVITAAHCINSGNGQGYKQNVVFIPDYRDGTAPFGTWSPAKMFVAQQWAKSADPDFDVGFAVLKPLDGKNIQDILGANQIGFDPVYTDRVRVTGYPGSADSPVTCQNRTIKQSATQLRFNCAGFYSGTSGSPWVTKYHLGPHTGTIVGVIGGYQQGGDTNSVSYSSYFGPVIRALYQQAEASSRALS